ncbi:hypothetical protein ACFSX9_10410 [Flavobacterium ardleyense]|uniref:Uncharacterized protein n=1 Tax=Flavobacterium ardleyense TaxID=2038737 RepID=A0ABW5Z8T5_9FLAO
MGLFDVFKKSSKYELPEMYNGIISKEEYNEIMAVCINYHKENNITITKIDEGELVVSVDDSVQNRYLDNLVRVLAANEKIEWQHLIYLHFDKMKDQSSAYNYLYKDFDYASQFLRVLIKDEFYSLQASISTFLHRVDFPKTNTFLVLEFEEQFAYVKKEDIVEWGKTENELIEIGIANTPENEIEVEEHEIATCKVFIFTSGDFAASLMLDIENRIPYTIGKYGTLIAIPSKKIAYAHPIEENNILDLIQIINPELLDYYNEDPGNVSTNYYWYYDEKIEVFPIKEDENGQLIRLPENLNKLFGNSST